MKVVIITLPIFKELSEEEPSNYTVDGNKSIEYGKPVHCPINGVLAKTLKEGEEVRFIYIVTTNKNSKSEENKKTFIEEIKSINVEIGADLKSFDTVEIDYSATNQAYEKLITDLTDKIPDKAEIFVDFSFGSKPETLSLFCALRFAEEFCGAVVQSIVYGKVEFVNGVKENPMLYDSTSLYYLFKLMGTIRNADKETASKLLKDFFAM